MKVITKINNLANWKSRELYLDKTWIYKLTKDDLIELDEALLFLQKNNLGCDLITKNSFPLFNLSQKLNNIAHYLEENRGIFLLRGFPVENYEEHELKKIFLGIGAYLGTSVKQSLEGERIYEVIDKGTSIKEGARGTSTKDPLPFHTDRCDVVALLCLKKSKEGGASRVVSSVAIHNEILEKNYELLLELYKPFFHARTAWERGNNEKYYKLPVFTNYQGYFATRYLRHFINEAQTIPGIPKLKASQIQALNLLEQIANDEEFCADMEFLPGDIQFLNNFVSLHSRAGYVDHENSAEKRKLLRLWLSVPNSRPLSPLFTPLYHNTVAGSIRGGIQD